MTNNKVLLIQGSIPHYRADIFNKLAEKVDLTVIYSDGTVPKNAEFKTIQVPYKILKFRIHTKNIYKIASKFDVVICMYDFSYICFRLLHLLPHKYKLIYWGIGVAVGYDVRYDSCDIFKSLKNSMQKSDALLFYCDYPKKKYAKMGIAEEKMFVADNTVKVLPIEKKKKDKILFVGSLYKQKKIFELLENYHRAYKKNKDIFNLTIIGDGDEYDNVLRWVKENCLSKKIELTGGIYDEEVLSKYFESAVMTISPDQAGLTVLKSMGYGVPFITHKDAITGGEIFNIHHNIDGVLLQDFNEIECVILDAADNTQKFVDMGNAAKKYYDSNRTVDNMVQGFVDAIEYVMEREK